MISLNVKNASDILDFHRKHLYAPFRNLGSCESVAHQKVLPCLQLKHS
jgi:hypothetical protein